EDLKGAVVVEAALHSVVEKTSIAEPAQAVVVSPDPERPVSVFVNRTDAIARQPFGRRVRVESAVLESGESPVSPEPESAVTILVNHFHVVARQSVFGRVVGDDSVAVKLEHPMVSSDPEIARAICSDRPRRRARDRFGQILQLPIFIPEQSGDRADPQPPGAVFPQSLDDPFGFDQRVVLESSVSELAQALDRADPDMAVATLHQAVDFPVPQPAFRTL